MLTDTQIEKYLFKYSQRHEAFIQEVGIIIATRVEANNRITSNDKPFSMGEMLKKEKDLNKIKKAQQALITSQLDALATDLEEISRSVYADSKPLITDPEYHYHLPFDVKKGIDQAKITLFNLIQAPLFLSSGKLYKPTEIYSTVVNDAMLHTPLLGNFKSMRNALERFLNARSVFEYSNTEDDTPPAKIISRVPYFSMS